MLILVGNIFAVREKRFKSLALYKIRALRSVQSLKTFFAYETITPMKTLVTLALDKNPLSARPLENSPQHIKLCSLNSKHVKIEEAAERTRCISKMKPRSSTQRGGKECIKILNYQAREPSEFNLGRDCVCLINFMIFEGIRKRVEEEKTKKCAIGGDS